MTCFPLSLFDPQFFAAHEELPVAQNFAALWMSYEQDTTKPNYSLSGTVGDITVNYYPTSWNSLIDFSMYYQNSKVSLNALRFTNDFKAIANLRASSALKSSKQFFHITACRIDMDNCSPTDT